jgi:hypothetical protein
MLCAPAMTLHCNAALFIAGLALDVDLGHFVVGCGALRVQDAGSDANPRWTKQRRARSLPPRRMRLCTLLAFDFLSLTRLKKHHAPRAFVDPWGRPKS